MGRKRRSRRNVKNIPENEEESNDVHLSFQGVSDSESPCQFNLRTLQWTENKVTKDQDFKLIETKTFVSYVRKIQANLLEECSQDPNSSLLVTIPLSLVNLKQHRDFGNQSLKFVQKSSEVQTLNIAQSSCLSKDLSLSESSEDEQMLNENLLHLNLTPKQLSVFVEDVKTKSKTCEVLPINSESSESDKTIKYASFRCLDNNAELENMCQFSNLTNTENSNSDSTILLKENYDYIPNILQGQIMNDNVIKESGTVEFPKIVEKLLRKPQGLLESQIFPKCFKQYDEGYQEEIVSEHSSEISHSSWDGVIPIDSEILNNAPDEILLDFNLSNFDMDKCDSGVRKGLIKENEDLAIGEWPLKVNENINCPTDNVAFIRSDDLLNEELDFEPDFEAENFSGFSTDSFKECESLTTQIPSKSDERNQADVTSTNSSVKGINHETEKKCAAKRPFSEAFTNSPVNNCSDELVTDNKSSPTRLPMETVSSEKVCASKLPKNNSTDTLLKNVYYLKDQNTKSNRPTKVKWERNFLLKNSIKHKKKKLSPVKSDHKVPFSRVKSATSDELELQPSIADLLDEEFISSPIQNRVISVAKHKENETNIASFQKADAPDNDPSKLGNSHKYDEPGKVVVS